MKFTVTNPKITVSHLSRLAVVYVRQSSIRQVQENTASTAFQYSLKDLAHQYSWLDDLILVIDKDQGRSGTSTFGRDGFKWLRQQIFEERVGAIICWDASRIARDSAALGQLIKLCAATDTLIIDEKGVYDPNNDNDRMFLGITKEMADAEGRRIASGSKTTKRTKAEKGELRLRPATGYVLDGNGKLVLDPRKRVQQALRLFFSTFDTEGTARHVVRHFNRKGIKFPTVQVIRGKKSNLVWGEINVSRALYILRNPMYAGTYAYARSKATSEMLSAEATE